MIKIWTGFARCNTSQEPADLARTILMVGLSSHLEIPEMCGHVCREQTLTTQIEITVKQKPPSPNLKHEKMTLILQNQ